MKLFSVMRRRLHSHYIWLACLILLAGFCWGVEPPVDPAKRTSTTDTPQAKSELPAPSPEPIVSDILRLRKQFGDPLEGTLLGNPETGTKGPLKQPATDAGKVEPGSKQSFTEALQRVRQATATNPAKHATREPGSKDTPNPVVLEQLQPSLSPLQQSLRQSWRLLEQRAAELEDMADYEQADQLRKLSRKIRLKSRQLTNAGPATRLSIPR